MRKMSPFNIDKLAAMRITKVALMAQNLTGELHMTDQIQELKITKMAHNTHKKKYSDSESFRNFEKLSILT